MKKKKKTRTFLNIMYYYSLDFVYLSADLTFESHSVEFGEKKNVSYRGEN